MIEYLQKFILGSLMLYSVYYLFLRNEKTLRFNRFYLLLIIPLSLSIPFLTVKTSYVEIPAAVEVPSYAQSPQDAFYFAAEPEIETIAEEQKPSFNWNSFIKNLYLAISLILLIRFILNLFRLNRFRKQGELIYFDKYKVCLRDDLKCSFTFLNTIFTNKSKYTAGFLPESILQHEMAHVQQKHSYDIILAEVFTIALWFNPVIYLIRQAIKLNHEYLADDMVCHQTSSPLDYQKTLINYSKLNSYNEPLMASRLTFGETKKRLNMMVKTTHKPTAWMKQSIGMATIATAIFIFGNQKVIARDISMDSDTSQISVHEDSILLGKKVIPRVQLSPETKIRFIDKSGDLVESEFGTLSRDEKTRFASPKAEGEVWTTSFMDSNQKWRSYQNLLESARPLKKNEIPNFFNSGKTVENKDTIPPKSYPFVLKLNAVVRFITEEGDTIKKTYSQLTPTELARFEKNEASPAYYAPQPAKMDIPENFATIFSDEKEYGVWLDGKRIKNSDLKNYSSNEIHHYYKSVLLKNAKNYGVHTFQLNIYTDKYMEGKPNGTWVNLLTIPEGGIEKLKEQKKSNKSGNGPFPSYVFHDDTKTRWVDEKGHVVKSTEKKGTEEFQFYVPPVKSKPISAEALQKYISNPQYHLWLNNEPVHAKHELEISADEIHHTQEIFSKGIHQLNIITKNYSKIEEIENGFWVTVPKEHVSQLITSSTDSK